jgi:senataxin
VLVCGPSNASVDEVIRKMLAEHLLDGSGSRYLPKFVRIGENYHESLQEHSLDYMANQQQKI